VNSYAQVRLRLPWRGVLWRFVVVCYLVFATYNPSHYSLTLWAVSGASQIGLRTFVLFCLALAWLIVLRLSLQGLGRLGAFYVASAFFVLYLIGNRLDLDLSVSPFLLIVMAELLFAAVITFGLVFSYWVRQACRQSPIVKHPP